MAFTRLHRFTSPRAGRNAPIHARLRHQYGLLHSPFLGPLIDLLGGRGLCLFVSLACVLAAPAWVGAATLHNSATGGSSGVALNEAKASVSLFRADTAVTSAVAEITPNKVYASALANPFVYNILPTIGPVDSGVKTAVITAPPGYANLAVTEVRTAGTPLAAACPAPGAGQYCATVTAGGLTVTFGDKVTTTLTRIEVHLLADAPASLGTADFTSTVADTAAPQATVPGNANNNPQDANSVTVEVARTQGQVLRLIKTANREETTVGGVVTYQIAIRNTVARDVHDVRVEDRIPPDFKYLPGTARLDGKPIADPAGNRPLVFSVGTVPALVDANGNGAADPGEAGYRLLIYQLVVGSGAHPGTYTNTAVAKDYCETCLLSNETTARVELKLDPLFDLGTIIGKVFLDANRNGEQDPGEPGVRGAMVALDDGTYALTDESGLYHYPAVRPGHRLVKLNLASLGPGGTVTTDESRVVSVTPGLMVKVNFGVLVRNEVESIGRSAEPGLAIASGHEVNPVEVVGSVNAMSLLVNGNRIALPSADIELAVDSVDDTVTVVGGRLETPARFRTGVGAQDGATGWILTLKDGRDETVRKLEGTGAPPSEIVWDGQDEGGRTVAGGTIYRYQLEVTWPDGSMSASPQRLLGVNRKSVVSVRLTGEAFEFNKDALSPKAMKVLDQVAGILKGSPDEQVVIEGHTDDVGSEAYNLDLAKRRAESALRYLTGTHGLPAGRFIVRSYGKNKPVASNATPEGRSLNRRVEIKGEVENSQGVSVLDRARVVPQAEINGTPAAIGPDGRFQASVAQPEARAIDVHMTGPEGAVVRASVPVPDLTIVAPKGTVDVPYGATVGGCRAIAKPAEGGGAGAPAAVCRLIVESAAAAEVELDGTALPRAADGGWEADVPLALGNNTCAVLARNAAGQVRLATVSIAISDRDAEGRLRVLTEGVPSLLVNLPPRGVKLPSQRLVVEGRAEPGSALTANGKPVPIAADGSFAATIDLPVGVSRLVFEVADTQGRKGTIERDVEVSRNQVFLMALADGKMGWLKGKGYLDGAGVDEGNNYYTEGRLAFYLKGRILGKYLITWAFDSGKDSTDKLFGQLDGTAQNRLIRNLDPDKLYPVYGDASTIVYDAESQGKFYLALDSDEIHAVVGNYPISLTGSELAAYQRTLYGGRVAYQSTSRTKYGDPDTQVVVFGAEVKQGHIQDNLRATGGTVYYLSHQDVVEGSEEVTLVVRDKYTNLVLSRQRQTRGIDYLVKYPEGRLLFNRPIASVVAGGAITEPNPLPGDPVSIEADYETLLKDFEKTSEGGRVRQQIGDHVAVGGTYVQDEMQSGRYELAGSDVEVRLGKGTRLIAEYAHSKGSGSTVYTSEDGGISYSETISGSEKDGAAVKVAADVDVGEWFGRPDRYQLKMYFKDLDPGFFSSGNFLEQGSRKEGVNVGLRLTGADTLQVKLDRDEATGVVPAGAAAETRMGIVQWNHAAKWWGLTVESFGTQTQSTSGNTITDTASASARFWAKFAEKLTTRIERQQTLNGPANDQTSAAVEYQVIPCLALEVKGMDGSIGRSAQAGAVWTSGKSSIYLAERLSEDQAGEKTSTILGARSPIGPSSRVYTEYQFENSDKERKAISLAGIQRQWDVSPGFRVLLSGEGAKIGSTTSNTTRTAVAAGISYSNPAWITVESRDEVRHETGDKNQDQYLTFNQINVKLSPDLTLQGRYRWSRTRARDTGRDEAAFEEGSLGIAFRPVQYDWLNLLARYSRIYDMRPTGASTGTSLGAGTGLGTNSGTGLGTGTGINDTSNRQADVFSVEAIVQLTPKLEWTSKLAARMQKEFVESLPSIRTSTYLGIQRLDINFWKRFELGAEYRVLLQRQADDRRQGWLGELMWRPVKNFRFGVGYNFTDFTDNEYSDNNYSTQGWFLRAQGIY